MTPKDGFYAVINADDTKPPFAKLAEAFSIALKMHRVDTFQFARKATHIFIRNKVLPQALHICELLKKRSINSYVVPESYFTEPGPTLLLTNANCLPEGFEIVRSNGTRYLINWREIAMLSYGKVRERKMPLGPQVDDDYSRIAVGPNTFGIYRASYRPVRRFQTDPSEKIEDHDVLDIFVGLLEQEEFAAHFRLNARNFYYDYLGDRMRRTSMENFRLFIEDIERYAPHAALTQKTVQFMNQQPAGRPFEGFAAFAEYTFWSIALSRVAKDGAIR